MNAVQVQTEANEPLVLTLQEAAVKLKVCSRTVRKRIAEGTLPGIKMGRRVLVPLAPLNRVLESLNMAPVVTA